MRLLFCVQERKQKVLEQTILEIIHLLKNPFPKRVFGTKRWMSCLENPGKAGTIAVIRIFRTINLEVLSAEDTISVVVIILFHQQEF